MQPIGYAVVGLGAISQQAVLPAFAHSRNARLVAVVSGDREKAHRLAAEFGSPHYYSYDQYSACLKNKFGGDSGIYRDTAGRARKVYCPGCAREETRAV